MTDITQPEKRSILSELWTFVRRHWLHLLLFPPGALLVTVLHESAHAATVLAQGGTINEFVWLPTGGHWGYVAYDPPALRGFSSFAVAIAPYVFWLFLAALAVVLSLRRRPYSFAAASSLYIWLFVIPLADVANAALPYLDGGWNDFTHAFGPPSLLACGVVLILGMLALIIGYPVQRRLYRVYGLRLRSYLVLSFAVIVSILCLTVRIF